MKFLWITAGAISLALGIIGIFLPILPTTPFVLLTAFCWAKSSDRLYQKLLRHHLFGKMIRDWQQHRAVPRRAKYLAISMMSLSVIGLFYRFWGGEKIIIAVISAIFCLSVAIWMWRLPDA